MRAFIHFDQIPPVPLHKVKLSDLMAAGSHTPEFEAVISRACSDPRFKDRRIPRNPIVALREDEASLGFRMVPVACGVHGYSLAFLRSPGTMVAYDGAGSIVGGFPLKSILVLPEHRGRGLGAEILIKAFETGVMHPDTMNRDNLLTTAGRANRIAAHRIAVERAVRAGVEVAPDVLADYADLLPEWSARQELPPSPGGAPGPRVPLP